MADGNLFDDESAERIERSVLFTEDLIGNRGTPPPDDTVLPPFGGRRRLGKTTVKHPKGETHPVDLYEPPDSDSEPGREEPTGETVDAYNRMCDLDEGIWVYVEQHFGNEEIYAAECPDCEDEDEEDDSTQ